MDENDNTFILEGGQIVTPDRLLVNTSIVVENGWIRGIYPSDEIDCKINATFPVISVKPSYLVLPGFIDLHIHGTAGVDVMDASEASLSAMATSLGQQGVTGFLATTVTAEAGHISQVMEVVAGYHTQTSEEARVLGIHLEGPFISKNKLGAHSAKWQRKSDIELFNRWQKKARGNIKQVTLAPEEDEDFSLIRYLYNEGVIASLGHSCSSARTASTAIAAGISHATHLFNAMSGFSHRNPGAAVAILLDEQVSAEIIADGVHVAPEVVRLMLRVKGRDKVILITDAMRAQSVGDGTFLLGDNIVNVQGNEARLADGTLAGSVLTMNKALKNMISFTGCDILDAAKMASTNPARKLGLRDVGSIEKGKKADLVILDENFQVIRTLVS